MNSDVLIYLIINAIRIGLALYLLSIFLEKEYSILHVVALGTLIWTLNSTAYVILNNNWLNLITNFLGLFIAAFVYHKGRAINKLLALLLDIALGIAVENIALVLFRNYDYKIQILTNIFSVFIFMVIVIILDRTIKLSRSPEISISSGLLLIVITLGLFFVGYVITYDTSLAYIELSLCVIMIINLSTLYLYNKLCSSYASQHENDLYKLQSEMYKRQLDIISKSNESYRILQHDMKHHILMLREYISSEENEKMSEYLDTISASYDSDASYVDSGNELVNSVLNYYYACIRSIGGTIESDIVLHDDMNIEDFDLNALLSNLLSNAYEAMEKTENPHAKIYIRYNRGILNIQTSNSYNGVIKKINNKYLTTKSESSNHGIGLISISRIVEKYNGYMEVSSDSTLFTVRIAIHV